MDDYRTKRKYRQRKLNRQGYYELRRQKRRAKRNAVQNGLSGAIPQIEQIFDPENLIRVFDGLQHHAGNAPGPDGIRYNQLGRREVGNVIRSLSAEILNGTYYPSKARHVRIPKANGRGYRTLSLRSILYRVVSKALADARGPYFDRMFQSGSHGFRPNRGVSSMLLDMERIIVEQQRYVIAQDDIANAFDHVPIGYAIRLYGQYIDDAGLLRVIEKVLQGHNSENRTVGIDQGSALSPLTLNVVLHHALDKPFSENAANPPWLRYADNLVYLSQSVYEGQAAIQVAQNLLQPIGMTLKGTDGPPAALRRGDQVDILGLSVGWADGRVQYDLAEGAWINLERKLAQTYMTNHTPKAAYQAIKGWMESCGPAFEGKSEDSVLNRILEIAAIVGQREVSHKLLQQYLQSTQAKWAHRRGRRSAYKAYRVTRDRERAVAPLTTDRPGMSSCPRPEPSQAQSAAVPALFARETSTAGRSVPAMGSHL